MARAFAFLQFLIICLGAFVLHLLVRVETKGAQPENVARLAEFLARHALWLFAVPILYAAIGNAVENAGNKNAIRAVGVVLCVILAALLGFPIAVYLF